MGGVDVERYLHLRREMVECEPTAFNVDPKLIPSKEGVATDFEDARSTANGVRYMALVRWGERQRVAGMIGTRIVSPLKDLDVRVGIVGSLYVPKYLRGHNVGRTLLRVGLHFLDDKVESVMLDVSSANPRAYDFYRRLGFEETGDHYPWWDGSEIKDIVMLAPVSLALSRL